MANIQDLVNAAATGRYYVYALTKNPTLNATSAYAGTLALGVGTVAGVKGKLWQKQDDGKTTNWALIASVASVNEFIELIDVPNSYVGQAGKAVIVNPTATGLEFVNFPTTIDEFTQLLDCPNSYVGQAGKAVRVNGTADGLEFYTPVAPVAADPSIRWFDIRPANGKVLPLAQPRAYYPSVLYNATPIFKDPLGVLRKDVCYYVASASAQGYAAFSDDGITWDNETVVTGVTGLAYHAATILIGGIIHLFYWNTAVSLYSAAATAHATFNPAVSCVASTSNAVCTGGYIYGASGGGNIRAGTYGFTQVFYNAAPTNNPLNPYSYAWCAYVQGTDGSQEGVLFATSPDGYAFSPWNALQEVVTRGIAPAWDTWIGTLNTFIDTAGLWHGFYAGGLGTGAGEDTNFGAGLGYVTSTDGITWVKYQWNPIIRKTEALKSWLRCYTPCIIKDASGYKMYYTNKSKAGIYTVVYATLNGFI